MMAELGGDDPLAPPAPAGQIVPDKSLRRVVAVALGRVDQVDAKLAGAVEHGVGLGLAKVLAPLPAELPRAQANDGNAEAGRAEPAVFHAESIGAVAEG